MCITMIAVVFFFFKQKTAYEMRISDWSSDVCSSDLPLDILRAHVDARLEAEQRADDRRRDAVLARPRLGDESGLAHLPGEQGLGQHLVGLVRAALGQVPGLGITPSLVGSEHRAGGRWTSRTEVRAGSVAE